MDETRVLHADERDLLEWFLDEWPDLAPMREGLPSDAVAEVFSVEDDGYRTITLKFAHGFDAPKVSSPYDGEALAEVEGHPFEALFFSDREGVMVELIFSAGTWPKRLPRRDELHPLRRDEKGAR